WATDASHSSSHSLKTSAAAPFMIAWNSTAFTVTAGTTYNLSMWAKASGLAGNASLNIHWYDASGNWLNWNYWVGGTVTGTTDWTQVGGSVTAPAGAVTAVIQLRAFANSGTVWLDDVSLTAAP